MEFLLTFMLDTIKDLYAQHKACTISHEEFTEEVNQLADNVRNIIAVIKKWKETSKPE